MRRICEWQLTNNGSRGVVGFIVPGEASNHLGQGGTRGFYYKADDERKDKPIFIQASGNGEKAVTQGVNQPTSS